MKPTSSNKPIDARSVPERSKSTSIKEDCGIDAVDKENIHTSTPNENAPPFSLTKANTDNGKKQNTISSPASEETTTTTEFDTEFSNIFETDHQQTINEVTSTFSDEWKNDFFLPNEINVATNSTSMYPTAPLNNFHHCCPFNHHHYSSLQHIHSNFYHDANGGYSIRNNHMNTNFPDNPPQLASSSSNNSGSSTYDYTPPLSNSITPCSNTATPPTLPYFGCNQHQHAEIGNGYFHCHCIQRDDIKGLNGVMNNTIVPICTVPSSTIGGKMTIINGDLSDSSSLSTFSNSSGNSSLSTIDSVNNNSLQNGDDAMVISNKRNGTGTYWPSYYSTSPLNYGLSSTSSSTTAQAGSNQNNSRKMAKKTPGRPPMSMIRSQAVPGLQKSRRTKTSYDPKTSYQLNTLFFETFGYGRKPTRLERRRIQKKSGISSRRLTYWLSNHKRRFKAELHAFSRLASAGEVDGYDSFIDYCKEHDVPELHGNNDEYSDVGELAYPMINQDKEEGITSEEEGKEGKQYGGHDACHKTSKGKSVVRVQVASYDSKQKQNKKSGLCKNNFKNRLNLKEQANRGENNNKGADVDTDSSISDDDQTN